MSLDYLDVNLLTIRWYCRRTQMCFKLHCPEIKEELLDVDDTASGTDWLMLNSQQYLMHCLQHRKNHHTVPARYVLMNVQKNKQFLARVYLCVSVLMWISHKLGENNDHRAVWNTKWYLCYAKVLSITLTFKYIFVLSDILCSLLVQMGHLGHLRYCHVMM